MIFWDNRDFCRDLSGLDWDLKKVVETFLDLYLELASFVNKIMIEICKLLWMDHRDTLVFLKLASFVNKILEISCYK